jgi:pimeloyl-ACP methyl ester carboxylesterase
VVSLLFYEVGIRKLDYYKVMRFTGIFALIFILALSNQAANAELQIEQVKLTTLDELEIHAQRITDGNDYVLIHCHRLLSSSRSFDPDGFGGVFLRKFDILAFDFRGHGKSEGFSTCGGDEVLDLRAAVQYARQIGYKHIVILGIGMGGTVAIRYAALFGNVDAVVAVSPLGQATRLKPWSWGMTAKVVAKVDYVRIPIRIFHGTRIGGRYLTGLPIHLVDRVSPIPLLVVHGDDGKYLNFRQTKSLYEKAKEPKRFLALPQSEYSEGLLSKESAETIADWLEEFIPREFQQNKPILESSQPPIPIREMEITGDVVLPEKRIKEAIKDAGDGASELDEQIDLIKSEAESLYRDNGYSLSQASNVQLSSKGELSLEMQVDKIHRLAVEGSRQATSEQIWEELQTEEGDYYNAWEIEKAMKRLSRLSVIADFENQLDTDVDGNTLRILIKEQRQWSIAPAIKIDSFDYFGGLSFSLNKYRPGALRIFGSSLAGLEYHNLIYRFNVEKSWLSDRALSTRFEFEQFINRRGVLDYYFARQEARERGGGVGLSYKVTDNAIIHSDFFRKKFAPVGGDEALPVGEGIINSLALRLENRGQFLQKGDSSINWRSQAFVETATKSIDGDYSYTVFQLNLYPQLILSPIHVLGFGMHWGTSWGDLPSQKMLSLGGIKTMPGYGYDAFLGEHIFLMRARYDLRFGKWLGNTCRWEPLSVSLLFDAGDARMKEKSLEFGAPRLEAGIEFSYASAIKIAIFKSLGKERVAPYIYFGWYPNIFLLKS